MLHVILRVLREVSEIEQSNLARKICSSGARASPITGTCITGSLFLCVLDLYNNKNLVRKICSSGAHPSPITGGERTERIELPSRYFI
jgi:hypothetical protein